MFSIIGPRRPYTMAREMRRAFVSGVMRHTPRKRFGQHFLRDEGIIHDIVAAISPQPDDLMLEIGPGLGALTRPLAAKLRRLHVVEIDRDLAARLRSAFDPARLIVHETDILKFDFSTLGQDLRVIGNLPYNISTPVLFQLALNAAALRDVHVMLQREVVSRMAARPGGSEYSRLSVMLQYHFDVETILDVPASAFEPPPQVESAVARLVPLQRTLTARDESVLAETVATAFAQRRKTLRNSLRNTLDSGDYQTLGLDPRMRAQELSVDDFVRIANFVAEKKEARRAR